MSRRPRRQRHRARLGLGVGRLLAVIALTVTLTALGLYQVNRRYAVVEVGYALDHDLVEYRRLLEIRKRLSLTLSAYKEPMAVRAFAEDALHMHLPRPQDELIIPRPDGPKPPPSLLGGVARQAGPP